MKLRIAFFLASLLGLGACTTANDPISVAWKGKSAGQFFARFGPPSGESGPNTYRWKGAYARVNGDLKSCSATVHVDDDYRIRSVAVTADRTGANGPSYCREILAPDADKKS